MNDNRINELETLALDNKTIPNHLADAVISDPTLSLLSLLNAAYNIRYKHWNNTVQVHIINNAQNGGCPEDCNYCAQAKTSDSEIEKYRLKPDEESINEAKRAYENGAHRYCMVSSGREPSEKRIKELCQTIQSIKKEVPVEVCLSAGFMSDSHAKQLKKAGLDRLNHNLNTSENHYSKICTTHTFQDRMNTLLAAKKNNLDICSGMIVGMGESNEDIIKVASQLKELKAPSIPINFLVPIAGTLIDKMTNLTPEKCLRILCLFRFINPKAELRVAAGRELHLRSMEAMAFYPANSIFLDGYLNTTGENAAKVYQMIKDAGFNIKSTKDIDALIEKHKEEVTKSPITLKTKSELRPSICQTFN